MIILGIGGILSDAACAISKDGQLIAAAEETKIAKRHQPGELPEHSIAFCLKQAKLDVGETLVLASDAFFPFRDTVDESHKVGVSAIIQPGGSIKDAESIQAADEHGMVLLFTGVRHFKH